MWPDEARYRSESIMTSLKNGQVPNWIVFLKMQNCDFCDHMIPYINVLARFFHAEQEDRFNYIVASIDCSSEEGLFMCEYLEIERLPRLIVLRPESGNRFFQFPLSYSKSPYNMFRFAVDFWPEAYTQAEFLKPGEKESRGEWEHYFRVEMQNMLEESAAFLLQWGFEWIPFYVMLAMSACLLCGPFVLCL